MSGSIYAWGFGKLGQLGHGPSVTSTSVPLKLNISKDHRPISISTGGLCTAFLTQKGDVFVCGCGKHGRLGTGGERDEFWLTPVTVGKDTKIAQISMGSWHSCAVTFLGRVYSWGYNSKHNVLGHQEDSLEKFTAKPVPVPALLSIKIRQVSCGHNFTLACTLDGQVYSWGSGKHGVLGQGSECCVGQPTKISHLDNAPVRTLKAGYAHCGIVTVDGRLYMFGKGSDGALGFGEHDISNKLVPTWHRALTNVTVTSVACSVGEHRGHTLALASTGQIYAFGSNHKGKLGLGDTAPRFIPTVIPEDCFNYSPVVRISAGGMHSGAVTADGQAWVWGSAKDGRLGHSTEEAKGRINSYYVPRPKIVEGLPPVAKAVEIECAQYHTVLRTEINTL